MVLVIGGEDAECGKASQGEPELPTSPDAPCSPHSPWSQVHSNLPQVEEGQFFRTPLAIDVNVGAGPLCARAPAEDEEVVVEDGCSKGALQAKPRCFLRRCRSPWPEATVQRLVTAMIGDGGAGVQQGALGSEEGVW